MNTIEKGDILEKNAIPIIKKYIQEGYFGPKEFLSFFTKKKYPTNIRNGFVEFDLSIEFKIPDLEKPSLTYFIECKNYKGRLPKDKVKKFKADVDEVKALNVKAILISSTNLQKGAYDFAEAYGIMVLIGEDLDNHKIILPRRSFPEVSKIPFLKNSFQKELIDDGIKLIEKQLDKSILSAFIESSSKVSFGIDKLSKNDISKIAETELKKFSVRTFDNAYGLEIEKINNYLKVKYDINVFYTDSIDSSLGSINIDKKTISINYEIKNTQRELFVICHEFGHYILHQNLLINNQLFNSFSDTIQTFRKNQVRLNNPKQWIEWQANYFSISFLIPQSSLLARLWKTQIRLGLKDGNLIIDDSNNRQVNDIIAKLSLHFNCSKTSIIFRLQEFDLIKNTSRLKHISEIIPEVIEVNLI